ncbi:MAG TPA: type II toxin-antitoxin system VapC family toxin [Gaiellaceae bacterium]|nr:type II toxin-antitoxin system VapC family toxin [Gaiellaceae bacterium]
MSRAPTAVYLDASALVKLVVPEPESPALRAELARWDRRVSSALVRAELIRAAARVGAAARRLAERVLTTLDLVAVDDAILDAASRVRPADLRTLDAVHLVSAQALGPALGGFVAYDARLLAGAQGARLPTIVPR